MALQEQNRRAMRLDADMTDAEGLMPMDEDGGEEEDYAGALGRGAGGWRGQMVAAGIAAA